MAFMPPEDHHTNFSTLTLLAWLFVILVIISLVGGYEYLEYLKNTGTPIVNVGQSRLDQLYATSTAYHSPITSGLNTASGYMLISFAYAGDQDMSLYVLDMTDLSLQKSPIQAFNPSQSMDGKYFVGSYTLASTTVQPNGIYLYDATDSSTQLFVRSISQYSRTPKLSPDDSMVVFNEPGSSTPSLDQIHTPSFWNIYVATKGASPRLVAHGLYPQWSPDGTSILYLSDGGLHLYTLKSKTDVVAYPVSETVTSFMQFILSKDGNKIAWSMPGEGQLIVGTVTWKPFGISVTNTLSAYAFWPVFSPDNTKIAFGQYDAASPTSTGIQNPRFTLVDLGTGEYKELLNLSSVQQMTFFATDWVQQLQL